MRPLAVVIGFLTAAATLMAGDTAKIASPGIEITCVGHEGYLLRGGDASVLLDSFIGPGESERDTLIRRSLGDLLAARPPFDRVTTVLISHPHDDHFDPQLAGGFLEKHPGTVLSVTPDVLGAIQQGFPRYPAIQRQLVVVKWGAGRRVSEVLNGVRVDFIKFAHEASQFYPDAVALHIVHINGVNVLHGADVELLHEPLAALHLERERLDVAFLPYSFLATPGAQKVFADHVGARKLVAMHLPSAGIAEAKAVVLSQFPQAIFLITPQESIRI